MKHPLVALVLALVLTLGIGAAQAEAQAPAPLPPVREIGSLHVGGRVRALDGLPLRDMVPSPGAPPIRTDPNGEFMVEGMYAQYVKLVEPRARHPLLLWHGGGLTGVTWETTPDGRPGWQMYFLRQGHDVYVSDAVERGRAGWARFPEIFPGEPVFRTMGEGWGLFRVGPQEGWSANPARRRAFPDTLFPVAAWDAFTRQSVPRWTTTDSQIQAAYNDYVRAVCPCVIIVHSQGGNFAFNAALAAPDKVRAVIAIEPSGTPGPGTDAAGLRDVPHLIVWGDHFQDSPFWQRIRGNVERWAGTIRAAGGRADVLDLPAEGIRGNSHMLMMDRNSDAVAARIQAWMEARGLMR
ncbi:esterase [Roseomonas sp. KE0001]|uniref:esterase n=1 Tax=unclassified Roseomonas TaxID=2617492 RepID=UPI001E41BED8|nr:esterase [Roseomonas sp. KE0001]